MKKNKKLTILVFSLITVIGVSLAYFTVSMLISGTGAGAGGTTATIQGSTVTVEGTLEFNDLDIYPGHQNVSSIRVTATGDNELIPYNVIWEGTNTINTPLNYTVYKTSSEIEVSATCEQTRGVIDGAYMYYEECNISNIDQLGTAIATGTISSNETKVTLVKDEFITSTTDGITVYYYVILEYPNLDEAQNIDIGGTFSGEVTIEESNTEPDINIIAAYIEQEDGSYEEVSDIPQSGYVINSERSTCSNGAIPTGTTPNITINNLNKSGTSCYLYFDESKQASSTIEGLYPDNQNILAYDDNGNLRYIGANPNNYVLFNNELWRIIGVFSEDTHGVSGEKLIKIIRSDSLGNIAWDSSNTNDWSTASLQTTLNGDYLNGSGSYASTGITSEAESMIETVTWKLGGYGTDSATAATFYSAERGTTVYSGRPTTWNGKVALMYPSDYGYATSGGTTTTRSTCLATALNSWSSHSDCYNNDWLYDSSTYQWTLTHYSSYPADVFYVNNGGYITYSYAIYGVGARPSVYLKSNIAISGGTGSSTDPYTLEVG